MILKDATAERVIPLDTARKRAAIGVTGALFALGNAGRRATGAEPRNRRAAADARGAGARRRRSAGIADGQAPVATLRALTNRPCAASPAAPRAAIVTALLAIALGTAVPPRATVPTLLVMVLGRAALHTDEPTGTTEEQADSGAPRADLHEATREGIELGGIHSCPRLAVTCRAGRGPAMRPGPFAAIDRRAVVARVPE
jgi:hypothetical protein